MNCPSCAHENRQGAKFCEECATPLEQLCAACGAELRPTAKFCDHCGHQTRGLGARGWGLAGKEDAVPSVSSPASPQPPTPGPRAESAAAAGSARKVVTILFADLAGSTALHERLDPESVTVFMERYYGAMRGAVEAHGGTVVKFLGDGVMAAFGVPRVAEDDASRGVRAGVALQQAFRDLAVQTSAAVGDIGLRVALNTGEVVVSADNTDIVGDPVNVAARLQQEARDGEVVIGESTQRLVAALVTLAPLGSFALKGRAEAVRAYRVASLERPASAIAAAFVGRDDELARLGAVYDAAVAKPAAHLAVLLGSPGLGKSRLIDELTRRLGATATVLTAHCDAAGGATFAPLAQALRGYLGIDDGSGAEALRAALETAVPLPDGERTRVVDGIAALIAGSPASPEETFFVVRRLLAALGTAKPVVLVIDDLHWAEPLLLDLVEHLVQWGAGVPLLVLVGARPELRDTRSSLARAGHLVSEVVTLAGLDAGAAMRLAANVIGAADLPAAVAAKVLATSEGNPLFVAELVRMLVQEGALKQEGQRWTTGAGLAALEMPPTIHALLAARIERLRPEERGVLERAAVIGRHFSRNAVAELMPREVTDLDARLESLRRSELIEPDSGWFLGEPVLRFHHVLIRDAAYRRLLKGTRAELHTRFADWVGRSADAIEHDETIGWHLEQAHQHLLELGPIDAKGRTLGERAATHLAAAGRRALGRDDLPLAASLLGRAIARLDTDDPARADLALDWCEALLAAGDVGPAAAAIEELARFIERKGLGVGGWGLAGKEAVPSVFSPASPQPPAPSPGAEAGRNGRLRAWHTCFTGQLTALTAPQSLHATVDAVAAAAAELAALGDGAGEAEAHFVHAQAFARLGKIGACEAALDRALAAARRAGDRRRANTVLAVAPLAALWGPSPVTRASGRCLDVVRVLRITQGAPAVEAVALSCQGVLEALRGRTDAARRMIASARRMVEDLGITQRLLEADVFAGRIELLEGDAAAAERGLRHAYEGLRDLGLGIDAARTAALLGRALLAQDRAAEAEELSRESEALAGDDLQASIAWRGVRAEALARRGEHAAAVELAEAAVEIAAATDALLDHADARRALAAALHAAGRSSQAAAEERRAIELWESKGATLLAERARRDGVRVDAVAPAPEATARRPSAAATAAAPRRPAAARPSRGGPGTARPTLGEQVRENAAASGRRVRENAAARNAVRILAALVAADLDAVEGELGDSVHVVHHPTGLTYDRPALLETFRRALRQSRGLAVRRDTVAAFGDSLCLSRQSISVDSADEGPFSTGPAEIETLMLEEIDGTGRRSRSEIFAADHLGLGIARLYERHAEILSDGPERRRAAARARGLAAILREKAEVEAWCATIADAFELVDHRQIGIGSLHGAEAMRNNFRAMFELEQSVTVRIDDVLAVADSAVLFLGGNVGISRISGGAFERIFLQLLVLGDDGRFVRVEYFEADHRAEALARFEELTAGVNPQSPAPTATPFANAASRTSDGVARCWAARDWDGVLAALSPALRMDDRRRLMRLEIGFEDFVAQFRMVFEQPGSHWLHPLLATRGERLSLHRTTFEAEVQGGGGPLAVDDHLSLVEVDADGRWIAVVTFDLDEVDAAYAELDVRFAAGEGAIAPHAAAWMREFQRAFAVRDWEALAALHGPDQVAVNHRTVGWGTLRGPGAWVPTLQALVELAADAKFRLDHLRFCERGILWQSAWLGTREGGPFETPLLVATELDEQGRQLRMDVWDAEQFEPALARFGELDAGPAVLRPAPSPRSPAPAAWSNAATRAVERGNAAVSAGDWEGFGAHFAPQFRNVDRRSMVQLELNREEYLESLGPIVRMTFSPPTQQMLATRGDRLVLARVVWLGTDGDVGPSEFELLMVNEVDERGDLVALVVFNADDLDAAYAELEARWQRGEGAAHPTASTFFADYQRCFATRDWESFAALVRPDCIGESHRLVGWGTLHGTAALLGTLQAQIELAPDTQERVDHVRLCERGVLWELAWHGSLEGGGEFESLWVRVAELDDAGRLRRVDVWDADQFEQAQARFEELGATAAPEADLAEFFDALAAIVKGGAAPESQRVMDASIAAQQRIHSGAAREEDWEALRASCAPDMIFEDRQGFARLSGDREMMIASLRERVLSGARAERTLVGTAGERVVIGRMLWTGGPPDGRFEIEYLSVGEMNAAGLVVAIILFSPDDARAAQREAWTRWAAIDPARAAAAGDLVDASNQQDRARYLRIPPNAATRAQDRQLALGWEGDWQAVRASHSPRLVFDDRRPGLRTTTDGDAYVAGLRWAASVASARPEVARTVLATAGDRLALQHNRFTRMEAGTLVYEIETLALAETDADGRLEAIVLFDPADRAAASAELFERYAASGADGAPAAVIEVDRALNAHDLVRLRAALPDDFVVDDHRTTGIGRLASAAAWVTSLAALFELSSDVRVDELYQAAIAPHGRVSVGRLWGSNAEGGAWESFFVRLFQYRGERLLGIELFEVQELEQALARLRELRAEPPRIQPNAASRARERVNAAFLSRDWDAMRALARDDFVFEDRRHWSMLSGAVDLWIRSTEAVGSVEEVAFSDEVIATAGDRIEVRRRIVSGTGPDGVAFESEFLLLTEIDGEGRLVASINFDVEASTAASAEVQQRFLAGEAAAEDEPFPDLLRVPPNAASRAEDRVMAAGDRQGRAVERTLLATAGQQLALLRVTEKTESGENAAGRGRPALPADTLIVVEVDAEGRVIARVPFDPADRAAAESELAERYHALTRPGLPLPPRFTDRGARNLAGLRARMPDDFFFRDHRRTGLGSIESADAYVASVEALFELSPDAVVGRSLHYLADEPHATLSVAHSFGTLADGGAFESVYVMIAVFGPEGMLGAELFELEDLEAAKVRFAELRPDPRRLPPNAATRLSEAAERAILARDWDGLRAFASSDFRFEDRGRRSLVRGDAEVWLESVKFLASEQTARLAPELLATFGERIALYRDAWSETGGEPRFELGGVRIMEVDAQGKLRALILFDDQDRQAAFAEAETRFGAGE